MLVLDSVATFSTSFKSLVFLIGTDSTELVRRKSRHVSEHRAAELTRSLERGRVIEACQFKTVQ
jgi:hypothetical protein